MSNKKQLNDAMPVKPGGTVKLAESAGLGAFFSLTEPKVYVPVFALTLFALAPLAVNEYYQNILNMILLFSIAGISWNIFWRIRQAGFHRARSLLRDWRLHFNAAADQAAYKSMDRDVCRRDLFRYCRLCDGNESDEIKRTLLCDRYDCVLSGRSIAGYEIPGLHRRGGRHLGSFCRLLPDAPVFR